MGKVDEEDEAEEDEDGGADEGDIITPYHEEVIWDEERDYDEDEPNKDFRAPPSVKKRLMSDIWTRSCFQKHAPVLNGSPLIPRMLHSNQSESKQKMEQRQRETNSMDLKLFTSVHCTRVPWRNRARTARTP